MLLYLLDPDFRRARRYKAELATREPLADAELVAWYFADGEVAPKVHLASGRSSLRSGLRRVYVFAMRVTDITFGLRLAQLTIRTLEGFEATLAGLHAYLYPTFGVPRSCSPCAASSRANGKPGAA